MCVSACVCGLLAAIAVQTMRFHASSTARAACNKPRAIRMRLYLQVDKPTKYAPSTSTRYNRNIGLGVEFVAGLPAPIAGADKLGHTQFVTNLVSNRRRHTHNIKKTTRTNCISASADILNVAASNTRATIQYDRMLSIHIWKRGPAPQK